MKTYWLLFVAKAEKNAGRELEVPQKASWVATFTDEDEAKAAYEAATKDVYVMAAGLVKWQGEGELETGNYATYHCAPGATEVVIRSGDRAYTWGDGWAVNPTWSEEKIPDSKTASVEVGGGGGAVFRPQKELVRGKPALGGPPNVIYITQPIPEGWVYLR